MRITRAFHRLCQGLEERLDLGEQLLKFAIPAHWHASALALAACACAPSPQDASPFQSAMAEDQAAWAAQCDDWDEWDKPAPPFRVYGNTYHVGTCGISAILITGNEGHILIDGGTENGGPLIAGNIAQLGFDIEDVEIILLTHEHFDHVGGLAYLQQQSGARVLASQSAAPVMESGNSAPTDPQHGILQNFAPVRVDAILPDNMPLNLGDIRIMPFYSPGHTLGAVSYQWDSGENGDWQTINYYDSLSPTSAEGYRFSDHTGYVQKYRDGLFRLGVIGCGILLTPHPSSSNMRQRILDGGLVTDTGSCNDYTAELTRRLDARLAQEAEGNP